MKHCQKTLQILVLLTATLIARYGNAQDPMFSQYYAAPLYLNPSLAGAETNIIMGVNYRTQWNKISPYQTAQASFSYPLVTNGYRRKHLGGIGVALFNESAGDNYGYKTYGFIGGGAYNLPFDKYHNNFISIGVQGGVVQRTIDNSLTWGSQYDPYVGGFNRGVAPSVTGLNYSVGFAVVNAGFTAFYNHKKISNPVSAFLGLAASNMNVPNQSFIKKSTDRLPMLFKANAGVDYALTKYWSISYNLLWMQQGGLSEINGGVYVSHKSHARTDPFTVTGGLWYRLNDSIIAMAGVSKSRLSIGISYDLNASQLGRTAGGQGAYELSLSYRIPKVKGLRHFSTPLI